VNCANCGAKFMADYGYDEENVETETAEVQKEEGTVGNVSDPSLPTFNQCRWAGASGTFRPLHQRSISSALKRQSDPILNAGNPPVRSIL